MFAFGLGPYNAQGGKDTTWIIFIHESDEDINFALQWCV